jgi:cytochrome c-type biogenesis protein
MAGSNITIPIAFIAGVASFLSPCVLPLVPGYVSLISGVSIDRLKGEEGSRSIARRAVILNSLAFNAGLSVIFLSLGTLAGLVGASIISNPWVRIIGGVVIIGFGLQLIGILKIGLLYKDTRMFSQQKPRGLLGSLTLGMAFAAGWTPCIGPILGGIIGLAATSGGWRSGLLLSSFYAAGLAVPFLVTGMSINFFLNFYSKFRRHLHKVEVVSGIVLILIGGLIMSNRTTALASSSVLAWIPNLEGWVERWSRTAGQNTGPVTPATGEKANVESASQQGYEPAPDIELQTLDGKPFRLRDLQGRVVMLNFWATWCLPCKNEIPELNAMQRDLQSKGLQIVGASWDDTAQGIREYQKDIQKLDYDVVISGHDVQSKLGNLVLPTTYIIDRQGRLRHTIIGARDRDGWESVVKPLLDEAPATAQKVEAGD